MQRRRFVMAAAAALGGLASARARGQQTPNGREPFGPGVALDLKMTLEKGLRARRPSEFAFIALVVQRVDEGALPLALVKSTFGWARRKRPYPAVYFERAMRIRAERIGVALDET